MMVVLMVYLKVVLLVKKLVVQLSILLGRHLVDPSGLMMGLKLVVLLEGN